MALTLCTFSCHLACMISSGGSSAAQLKHTESNNRLSSCAADDALESYHAGKNQPNLLMTEARVDILCSPMHAALLGMSAQ